MDNWSILDYRWGIFNPGLIMAAGITHLSYCLPKGELTHNELQQRFGHEEMDRLITNTGITSRRVSTDDECASDFAFTAAKSIFDRGDISPKDIDQYHFSSSVIISVIN